VQFQSWNADASLNYGYAPVVFESEGKLEAVVKRLNAEDIYPRRYFYPSLDKLDYVESNKAIHSRDISKRILCLPTYFDLKEEQQKKIAGILLQNIN